MSTIVPAHEIYRTHMFELKLRLTHCEKVVNAPGPLLGLPAMDWEFCFLQIRKIVELIAFSSVLRDEDRYKRFRETQRKENARDHGDHTRDWEAPEILRRLAQISPYCLPIPLKLLRTQNKSPIHFDLKNISVTHGRLIEIYKTCGGFLHSKNPFSEDFRILVNNERKKYDGAQKEIKKYLDYFRKLMWYHAAVSLEWESNDDPKEPANPKAAWIVNFGTEEESAIHITLAEAYDE